MDAAVITDAVLGLGGLAIMAVASRLHFDYLQLKVVRANRRGVLAIVLMLLGSAITAWGAHMERIAPGSGMIPFVLGGAGALNAFAFVLVTWMTNSQNAYIRRRQLERGGRKERIQR